VDIFSRDAVPRLRNELLCSQFCNKNIMIKIVPEVYIQDTPQEISTYVIFRKKIVIEEEKKEENRRKTKIKGIKYV
jgi:hypothetical protein